MDKGKLFISLLKCLVRNEGSDLHVSSNNPPMIRVRGEMEPVDIPRFSPEEVKRIIMPILNEKQKEELQKHKSVDFSFQSPSVGIFRANVFYQRHGLAFVLRVLPLNPPSLEDLGFPASLKRATQFHNGLVLVTGPTGSGKSTTLAAMLNYINGYRKGHIITIEDPIEYIFETRRCLVNQRALGNDFMSFSTALRAALREDPDVILVGEMRDLETMKAAIHAAETGHLVLSTLHTNSASKTVDRIINSFPSGEQAEVRTVLAETLRMVISQKLVLTMDRTKRKCFQDILMVTDAVANLIREGKTYQIVNSMLLGKKEGMQLLDVQLAEAVEAGEIRAKDAYAVLNERSSVADAMPTESDEQIKSFIMDIKQNLLRGNGPGMAGNQTGIHTTLTELHQFRKALNERTQVNRPNKLAKVSIPKLGKKKKKA